MNKLSAKEAYERSIAANKSKFEYQQEQFNSLLMDKIKAACEHGDFSVQYSYSNVSIIFIPGAETYFKDLGYKVELKTDPKIYTPGVIRYIEISWGDDNHEERN